MRRIAATFLLAGAAALALAAGRAGAQEVEGSVTLYGWLPWIDGDITAARGSVPVSIGGGDVLEVLDFSAMGAGQVQYGRFGASVDVIYSKFSQGERLAGPLSSKVGVDVSSFFLTGALSYRALETERAQIDALAGFRLVSMETDVSVTGGGPAGIRRTTSGDATFVDPLIGLRGRFAVGADVTLVGLADIGGFGVGSEFSWEVYAGISYAISERVSTEAGFRAISIDYANEGREFDLVFFGPALGLTIHF